MTRDRNFVVDTLASRGMPQIVVCCGAGHAYKSVPRQRSFSHSSKHTITYDSVIAFTAVTGTHSLGPADTIAPEINQ